MVIIPFRRCTDAHLKKTILKDGEIAINESTKTIHYGDNKTPGGIPIKALNADNATHAVNADSATNDSKGQNIAGTYIKGFSVSGQTVTYTRGDGTTGKFTTQDNNTTYSAGANITLSGTTFSLTKANVVGALGYTPPTQDTNTTYSAGANITLSGTTFSLTKANVVGALGYTPPTQDTNTTYSAGANITLSGTTFSLTKANVVGALGYTPPTQDTNTTYSAGSNLWLNGTQFNVSSTPSFSNVTVANNSSNGILFGDYRIYVG